MINLLYFGDGSKYSTQRAVKGVSKWWIGVHSVHGGRQAIIRKALQDHSVQHVSHAPCTLKTSFVHFEKELAAKGYISCSPP
jgi:hypothetical protein